MRRTIAIAAFVIAAMGLGRLITDHLPTSDVADEPFFRAGTVGKTVSLDYADVTVTGVHVAPTILGNPGAVAGGRWLIVDVTAVATKKPVMLAGFFLVDGQDRRWIASNRGPDCTTSLRTATGVKHYGSICFDIPEKARTGARLMVTRGNWDSHESYFRRDDVADIDLGIKAADVRALWDQKDGINVEASGPVAPEEAKR